MCTNDIDSHAVMCVSMEIVAAELLDLSLWQQWTRADWVCGQSAFLRLLQLVALTTAPAVHLHPH